MRGPTLLAAWLLGLAVLTAPSVGAASSGDELVNQAQAHEQAHEDAVAARRYMEALAIEPTHEGAWMGLGALRLRLGELAEAERVFDAALLRVPGLRRALAGRAHARWAQGRHAEAEADLESFAVADGNVEALRELAGWYGADGRLPAQLAVWRRLLSLATDPQALREARGMVRALVILVDSADPAASGVDPVRRALAAIARRAG